LQRAGLLRRVAQQAVYCKEREPGFGDDRRIPIMS